MTKKISLLSVLAILPAIPAHAFHYRGTGNGIHYSFYAPDWVWQKSTPKSTMGADINVLGVLENTTETSAEISVSLTLPEAESAIVADPETLRQSVALEAGETQRIAFARISALNSAPPGDHVLILHVRAGDHEETVSYPVKTVRGAAVSRSAAAKLLPAAISLGWCFVLWLALRRHMKPNTWREPFAPKIDPEDPL